MTGGDYSIASHAYGRYRTELVAYFLLTTGAAYASCSILSSVLYLVSKPHTLTPTPTLTQTNAA